MLFLLLTLFNFYAFSGSKPLNETEQILEAKAHVAQALSKAPQDLTIQPEILLNYTLPSTHTPTLSPPPYQPSHPLPIVNLQQQNESVPRVVQIPKLIHPYDDGTCPENTLRFICNDFQCEARCCLIWFTTIAIIIFLSVVVPLLTATR